MVYNKLGDSYNAADDVTLGLPCMKSVVCENMVYTNNT